MFSWNSKNFRKSFQPTTKNLWIYVVSEKAKLETDKEKFSVENVIFTTFLEFSWVMRKSKEIEGNFRYYLFMADLLRTYVLLHTFMNKHNILILWSSFRMSLKFPFLFYSIRESKPQNIIHFSGFSHNARVVWNKLIF